MAYGLNVSPTHGYRVEAQALNGNISAIAAIDQSMDGGIAWKGAMAGRRVETHNVPTQMKWLDRNRHPLPDFDNNLLLNVSGRAKQIIEELEPDVHQFVPVTYCDIDGRPLDGRYFLFVCNRIDGVNRAATTLVLHNGFWQPVANLIRRGNELPPEADPNAEPVLVLSADAVAPYHLWRDKHLIAGPYVSRDLVAAFKEAELTGLDLSAKMKVM